MIHASAVGRVGIFVVLAACATGCAAPEPVGSLAVDPPLLPLPYPESGRVQLTWNPTAPLDEHVANLNGRPTVFVHLLGPTGKPIRTFDHVLPDVWEPGVAQSYSIDIAQSALAAPLGTGSYGLSIGLYDVDWGYRWPIRTGGTEVATREYRVATVEVPDDRGGGPRFEFTPGWLPAEHRDQQVPMRRRLAAAAGVRVGGLTRPGTLIFVLTIGDEAGRLPVVRVRSDCDGAARELTGSGTHTIEIRFDSAHESASCAVDFEPAGALAGCGVRCPAFLEQATFRPDR